MPIKTVMVTADETNKCVLGTKLNRIFLTYNSPGRIY